ncbi:MAG: ribonuclease HIII [Chlamydiae bacterium RIFCSPHIGHO2_12_FULL_49_9]|nr:MAG: ribonuclease HIII [Chlamydiae bacterium RIFCSPHIGHO2_12_FULL_49_9]
MNKSACFTATVSLDLAGKLENDLVDQGFEISKPPYTLFSAKKKGISCTFYESGKLTVQGKDKDSFIEFYLEPEILKEFKHSHAAAHLNLTPRIGMDEAGKGDFFGPLCVAAVYADGKTVQKLHEMGVKDSKTFSDASILKLAQKVRATCPYTVIRLFPLKYNELHAKFKNLNRLLAWAHTAALHDLVQKTGCKEAILDQFADKHVMETFIRQKKLEVNLQQKVRGEEDTVVAAASILARAGFLEGLKSLSEEIGLELPKGASQRVIEAGRQIVAQKGIDTLKRAAKTHFKTFKEL